MEKLLYLAFASPNVPVRDGDDVLAAACEVFGPARYRGVTVQLPRADVEAARRRERGVVLEHVEGEREQRAGARERLVAMVSLWLDCADDHTDADAFMSSLGDHVRGYSVAEAVPHWVVDDDGNGPPDAVVAVTLMRPAPGTDGADLVRHWCEVHMPLSLRTHPQWSYIRNLVVRPLLPEADPPVAIAEQGIPHPDDLVDGRRFYGGFDDESYEANRAAILADVPRFLDPTTTETFVTQEHVLRRAWMPLPVDRRVTT